MAIEYTYERAKPFAGSEFANFVRHDIAEEARKTISLWPFDLTLKSSVGAGNWAAVPWLAFFDPIETTGATRGNYVVFLVNAQANQVVLSLNQGTTEVYREFGEKRGREELMRRAARNRERVADFARLFDVSSIDLGSNDSLPRGYEAGHAFGRVFELNDLDQTRVTSDLHLILEAYTALIDRGSSTPSDEMFRQSGTMDIEETRKYVLSRRIERAPKVRSEVLSRRQPVCECCGFDPAKHFSYNGKLTNTPLDVHHSKPIRELREGEMRRYKVPDDFLVLCPTCHRMIHKQDDTSDLSQLKRKCRFILAQDLTYSMQE